MPRRNRREVVAKRQALHRSWRGRIPWIPVGAAVVVLVAGYLLANSFGLINPVGERLGQLPRAHIAQDQTSTYNSIPPTSGAHSAPASWGVSSQTVPDESAVHNLEHGGVVISYNQIPNADLTSLQSFVRTYPRNRLGNVKIVLHPYPKIPAGSIVLTAWGWIDRLSGFDEKQIRTFAEAHLDRCCESVD